MDLHDKMCPAGETGDARGDVECIGPALGARAT